jgi:hypothetical protein
MVLTFIKKMSSPLPVLDYSHFDVIQGILENANDNEIPDFTEISYKELMEIKDNTLLYALTKVRFGPLTKNDAGQYNNYIICFQKPHPEWHGEDDEIPENNTLYLLRRKSKDNYIISPYEPQMARTYEDIIEPDKTMRKCIGFDMVYNAITICELKFYGEEIYAYDGKNYDECRRWLSQGKKVIGCSYEVERLW